MVEPNAEFCALPTLFKLIQRPFFVPFCFISAPPWIHARIRFNAIRNSRSLAAVLKRSPD
jgi:hypothetical protein